MHQIGVPYGRVVTRGIITGQRRAVALADLFAGDLARLIDSDDQSIRMSYIRIGHWLTVSSCRLGIFFGVRDGKVTVPNFHRYFVARPVLLLVRIVQLEGHNSAFRVGNFLITVRHGLGLAGLWLGWVGG